MEVDLVEQKGRTLVPMEIKSAATFNADFCKDLGKFTARYQDVCANPTVAYTGAESFTFKGVSVVPFHLI